MPHRTTSTNGVHGRVLVAERDARWRAALRLIAGYDGHEVRAAADRDDTLVLVREFQPHVVLLDPQLSEEDAPTLCEEIGAAAGPDRTAIILTSRERVDRRALRWIVGRVTRPFDFQELRLLIARELARLPA